MDDRSLDRAIDDVARDMTAAELPPAFRAGVIARLGDAPRRPAGLHRALTWAAAAACVVIAAGVWWAWPADVPVSTPAAQVAEAPGPGPADTPAPASTGPVAGPSGPVRPDRARAAARPQHVRRPAGLAWESGPDALPVIAPIAIPEAGPAPLDIPGIDIEPMQHIAPITIPAAGPGQPDPERRDR